MPKISEPTLAEHQARQRSGLLDAAMAALADEGVSAVTPGAVGKRAGLARASVYQYFDSSAALLAAAVEEAMARQICEISEALAMAEGPAAAVEAYVKIVLDRAGSIAWRAVHALERAELPAMCRMRLEELKDAARSPLQRALAELRVAQPELSAVLVAGACDAAAQMADARMPRESLRAATLEFIHCVFAQRGT